MMDTDFGNGETIRSIAVKLVESKLKNESIKDTFSRALFILGSRKSGKTTLINAFLEKEDISDETIGLEYTFGRKNVFGSLNEKNVCHIWELGGEMFTTLDIFKVPFQAHKKCEMTIVLFLDLSQPRSLWSTVENYINNLKSVIEKNNFLRIDDNSHENQINDTKFPFPLIIVGAKYDIFNDFDVNSKKLICKSLRCVAHMLGASLLFFSKNDQATIKRLKDVFNHVGFGMDLKTKGMIFDSNKPFFIISGNDSWENINIGQPNWDFIKNIYITQFPQVPVNVTIPDDPSLEANFREPLIDQLRDEKDEELKIMLKKSSRDFL